MTEYTADELRHAIEDEYGAEGLEATILLVNRWLKRGDGAAVYQNQDLGHPELGRRQIMSYGSKTAMIESDTVHVRNDSAGGREVERAQAEMRDFHKRGFRVAPVPGSGDDLHPYGALCGPCSVLPVRLPDTRTSINWRYQLVGFYRGEPL